MGASGYWKEVQLRTSGYCAVTQFAINAAPNYFFSPYVVNVENNGIHVQ